MFCLHIKRLSRTASRSDYIRDDVRLRLPCLVGAARRVINHRGDQDYNKDRQNGFSTSRSVLGLTRDTAHFILCQHGDTLSRRCWRETHRLKFFRDVLTNAGVMGLISKSPGAGARD